MLTDLEPSTPQTAWLYGSPQQRATDTQWIGAESWSGGRRRPPNLASFNELQRTPAFFDPSGGIRFEKTTFQPLDHFIAQSDVVRVTAE